MSLVEHEVSPRQVAANQSNAQKSTGPRTREGKARVALNALKTGAYAKGANALRQFLVKSGDDPQEREQLHQDLMESWQPDDTMQAIMVQVLADKTWEMLQLRGIRREIQLTDFEIGQVQAQRRQLHARRWRPGAPALDRNEDPPLWLSKDRPHKFKVIFEILDDLQQWYDNRAVPEEFGEELHVLYGAYHSVAGERIRNLFIDLFKDDKEAAAKAEAELPKWIAQERRDVHLEQELYRRESELRSRIPALTEEQVAAKESALQRQIAEQTRLLLQLKSKRSLWPAQFEAGETSAASGSGARTTAEKQNGDGSNGKGSKGEETAVASPAGSENRPEDRSKPSSSVESTT